MKISKTLLPLCAILFMLPAAAEPVQVRLADYAFNFPTFGYEIKVTGTTSKYSGRLTSEDHIIIVDDGYGLKTLTDRMSRRDRQQFISFFNEYCITSPFSDETCSITASGDIELDERMRMIFRMSVGRIAKGGNVWSNEQPNH